MNDGQLAVSFFFVLSGFLITYLLLREHQNTRTINVRAFYMRRVLRILPLYYLLVFLGLGVVPPLLSLFSIPSPMSYAPSDVLLWYLFVLPFVVNIYYDVFVIGPLWSIGVEELYYLIIAPTLKRWIHRIPIIFTAVIILRLSLLFMASNGWFGEIPSAFIRLLAFDLMALGGLAAWFLYHSRQRIEELFLWTRPMQVFIYILLFCRIAFHKSLLNTSVYASVFNSDIWSELVLALIFAWLIIEVAVHSKALLSFSSPILQRAGDISYGLYMFHNLVAFSLVYALRGLWMNLSIIPATMLYHSLLLILTVGVAWLSKTFYENKFLALKTRLGASSGSQGVHAA